MKAKVRFESDFCRGLRGGYCSGFSVGADGQFQTGREINASIQKLVLAKKSHSRSGSNVASSG
jgi:hypothetical protein